MASVASTATVGVALPSSKTGRSGVSTCPSRATRRALVVRASNEKKATTTVAAAGVAATALAVALPETSSAAQEVMTLAQGEPVIVVVGWAALAASFTISLALVVWGRSGL